MKLLIEDDQGNRSVVPVIRDEITIGRNEGNTIRLTERNVSRRHARLVRTNGKLYVEDVKARYGVKKNGQTIDERAEFGEGDVVLIGDYRLTLRPEQKESAKSPDVNGSAAAEISPELQDEPTKVKDLDEVTSSTSPKEAASAASSPSKSSTSSAETEVIQTDPAKLVVVSSNFAGQEFPLDHKEMVIGRGEECDIIIDHRSVSNTHAKVIRESAETYKIVDLNSRNGLKVDDDEYKSVHLERGDVVELGHVKFRFVEPGENYVFDPKSQQQSQQQSQSAQAQSSSDEIAVTEPVTKGEVQGSSMTPALLVGAGIVALAVVGGVVFALSSGGGGDSQDPSKGADRKKQVEAKEPADHKKAAPSEDPETNQKVTETIDQAAADIEAGKLEKAIGSLESTKNLLEPSPEQGRKIDELLSTARNEQPFRRRFESARQAIRNDNYQNAVKDLDKIPDHSVFAELAADEELKAQALDGLLEKARAKLDETEVEEAKTRAKLALSYESHKKPAKELLESIENKEGEEEGGSPGGTKVARQDPTPDPEPDPEPTGSGGSGGSSTGSAPQRNTISAAQAKKLFQSATKKWIRGDDAGAIADCRKAVRAGHHDCYRVIGMAEKRMGNKQAACNNFKRYLSTSPSDASKIRGLMDQLGCK